MRTSASTSLHTDEERNCKCSSALILQPQEQTTLQTDSSIKGLGACLLQDGRSVYFVGKAVTYAQKGYVAIELESLAVAWTMEKFHHFLYASHFLLESDQKPFEAILSKSIIHQITNHLRARNDSLNQIRIATQEDDKLALLKHTIMHGWPSTIREVPSEIQPY